MINASKEFKDTMMIRRDFLPYLTFTFNNGIKLNVGPERIMQSDFHIVDGAGANTFPIGAAIAKTVKFSLSNYDDYFSSYDFYGARIDIILNFKLSESVETIKKGRYIITTPQTPGEIIDIEAVDEMCKADKDYDSEIKYPAAIGAILRDSCVKCGILLYSDNFPNSDFIVNQRPTGVTYREVIGYVAQLAAGNARININNQLEIVNYNTYPFEGNILINAESFSENITEHTAGGQFGDNTYDCIFGGDVDGRDDLFVLYNFMTPPVIDTDDIVITGLTAVRDAETSDKTGTAKETVSRGESGYTFEINNPMLEGKQLEDALERVGAILIGVKFRKFSGDILSNPLIEFGDPVYVYDRKMHLYESFVTDIDFCVAGTNTVQNSAENAALKEGTYNPSYMQAFVENRNEIHKEKIIREQAVDELGKRLEEASGLYSTVEKQDDGSYVYYMHDKKTKAESKIVWKMTADAFGVSTDGGNTWNAGLTVDGNLITKVLSATGINAEWVRTGSIRSLDFIAGQSGMEYNLDQGSITCYHLMQNNDIGRMRIKPYGFELRNMNNPDDALNIIYDDSGMAFILLTSITCGCAISINPSGLQIAKYGRNTGYDNTFFLNANGLEVEGVSGKSGRAEFSDGSWLEFKHGILVGGKTANGDSIT